MPCIDAMHRCHHRCRRPRLPLSSCHTVPYTYTPKLLVLYSYFSVATHFSQSPCPNIWLTSILLYVTTPKSARKKIPRELYLFHFDTNLRLMIPYLQIHAVHTTPLFTISFQLYRLNFPCMYAKGQTRRADLSSLSAIQSSAVIRQAGEQRAERQKRRAELMGCGFNEGHPHPHLISPHCIVLPASASARLRLTRPSASHLSSDK
jgi:hypothetical protein